MYQEFAKHWDELPPLTAGWDCQDGSQTFSDFLWPGKSNLSRLGPRIVFAIPYCFRHVFFCASTENRATEPRIEQ